MENHIALETLPQMISKVIVELLKRVPDKDCYYTIKILLWNDNSYKVVAQHGNDDGFIYAVYMHDNELGFQKTPMLSKAMSEDAQGNEFYVLMGDEIEERRKLSLEEII